MSGACNGCCLDGAVPAEERRVDCTGRDRLEQALHTYFKLRPGQLESSLPALHGKDVLVPLAPSNGNSHQPFECIDGTTLVIV